MSITKHLHVEYLFFAVCLSLCMLSTGCASFKGNKLEDLGKLDSRNSQGEKKAYVNFKYTMFGSRKPALENKIKPKCINEIKKVNQEAKVFQRLISEAQSNQSNSKTYRLEYHLDNYGNMALVAASGFITGASLLTIPGVAIDKYTLELELYNQNGARCWQREWDSKMTTVIWVPLIFHMFADKYQIWEVRKRMRKNMFRHSLKDLSKSGVLDRISRASSSSSLSEPPEDYSPPVTALWQLTSQGGVDKRTTRVLTESLQHSLIESGWFKVLARGEMKKILQEQEVSISASCGTTDCAVEYGQMLSVEKIIVGSVSRVAGTYQVNLKLVDVATREVNKSAQVRKEGKKKELFDLVKQATSRLVK